MKQEDVYQIDIYSQKHLLTLQKILNKKYNWETELNHAKNVYVRKGSRFNNNFENFLKNNTLLLFYLLLLLLLLFILRKKLQNDKKNIIYQKLLFIFIIFYIIYVIYRTVKFIYMQFEYFKKIDLFKKNINFFRNMKHYNDIELNTGDIIQESILWYEEAAVPVSLTYFCHTLIIIKINNIPYALHLMEDKFKECNGLYYGKTFEIILAEDYMRKSHFLTGNNFRIFKCKKNIDPYKLLDACEKIDVKNIKYSFMPQILIIDKSHFEK